MLHRRDVLFACAIFGVLASTGRQPVFAQKDQPTTWLKVQFYTQKGNEGRWGGTDGDVYFDAWGSFYYGLNSPGDSFEQGDYDIFYLKVGADRTGRASPIRGHRVHISSEARNRVDNWSYDLEVYELVNGAWTQIYAKKNQEAYAVSRNDETIVASNSPNAAAHYDASAKKWDTLKGVGPAGVKLSQVSRKTSGTFGTVFTTSGADTYTKGQGRTWTLRKGRHTFTFREDSRTRDWIELTNTSGDHNNVRLYGDHVKYLQRDERGNQAWRTFPDSRGSWR